MGLIKVATIRMRTA